MIITEAAGPAVATSRMDLTKLEKIRCPLCDEPSHKHRHSIRGWSVVACSQCDFVYVNPRLEKNELLHLYTQNYFDNKEVGYYHYTENKDLRKANFSKWVKDALPHFSGLATVNALDVGCAAGYCLDVFRELRWNAYGIELDKSLAADLRRKAYTIFDEPLVQLTTLEKFRFISLFDVIEHLTDLPANMAMLHSLLEDDGIVALVTPNYNSWQRKFFRTRWFQFKPVEHINYFTKESLEQLAASAGFSLVHSQASGQFCDMPFLENRLRKYGFGFALPSFRLLTRLFGFRKKYFYTDTASLYVILKKNAR